MAYTSVDNPELYFQNKLYSGDGTNGQAITLDGSENMQPDWTWIKSRSGTAYHELHDSVRGAGVRMFSNETTAEQIRGTISSFDSDGFTVSRNSLYDGTNASGVNFASWNWLAGGTAPAITYSVKVVSDSGNKYRFDDFGTSAVTLDLQEGGTYTFDQSDSSNSGHPLRFSTTSNGTHGGGSEYTTGVTTTGTPGSSGAKTIITIAASAPTLYYYCTQHSGMGGQANTNSTHGSSNFSGSIQSVASANTTAGFSIVSFTGNATAGATIGHGLGVAPQWVIVKNRANAQNWFNYHIGIGATKVIYLDLSNAQQTLTQGWNDTAPTSSVVSLGTEAGTNQSGSNMIAYCFAEKKGYSKFGSYTGNGNADGTFIYTGFKPAWVLIKNISSAQNWIMFDNKRPGFNVIDDILYPNQSDSEQTQDSIDFLSNGFKIRATGNDRNGSGNTLIYMAFAESPFVNSNGVPNNAR